MKVVITGMILLLAAGCASTGENEQKYEHDKQKSLEAIQETEAFVNETKPQEVSWLRYKSPAHFEYLNNQYVILETRKAKHLIRVKTYCPELTATVYSKTQLFDDRSAIGFLRANADTIRGCPIDAIYRLSGDEETENGAEQ